MRTQSQSQVDSNKSFVGLGLMLTQKILSMKMKLKQINPTLIFQWDGQTQNNQISGKGIFKVRNSHTNQITFQCEVKKWKNGIPEGQIKMKKINYFSKDELIDYKVKQIQSYEGNSLNLKKHGEGSYKFQQFFSSGRVKNTTIIGQWNNDILVKGRMQSQKGKKQLNLSKNIQWSKSNKNIHLRNQQFQQQNLKSRDSLLPKKHLQNKENISDEIKSKNRSGLNCLKN